MTTARKNHDAVPLDCITLDRTRLLGDWFLRTLTNPTSGTTHLTLTSSGDKTNTFDFVGAFSKSDFTIDWATTTIKFA